MTVALSLNLGGLFEIPTPGFVNQAGGAGGAFATGALAAFIATPCTGPFMGAALGASGGTGDQDEQVCRSAVENAGFSTAA